MPDAIGRFQVPTLGDLPAAAAAAEGDLGAADAAAANPAATVAAAAALVRADLPIVTRPAAVPRRGRSVAAADFLQHPSSARARLLHETRRCILQVVIANFCDIALRNRHGGRGREMEAPTAGKIVRAPKKTINISLVQM